MSRTKHEPTEIRVKRAIVASVLFLGQAALCGTTGSTRQEATMRDAWSPAELKVLSTLRLSQLPPTPADPSNAVDALPAAVELGKKLFQDARLSANAKVSCASCHIATKQFQDGLPLGRGVGIGSRRTMPIIAAGHSPWLFWDGRKDSLWAQALGPLEDAAEHGGNRLSYAKLLQRYYRPAYEEAFGAMPDLKALPADASPNGSAPERAAWQTLSPETQRDINRIFANLGKAIAAYEKTLPLGATRFDRYVEATFANNTAAAQWMTVQEANGLRIFIGKGQCVTCHNGPLLSDQSFHNTGVPPRAGNPPDRGRAAAIQKVQNDLFNCLGPFSDAKPAQCLELRFMSTSDPRMEGAFKTPSLRNVALRPPYMHAGQIASLEEVITHYMRAPAAPIGQTERKPLQFSVQEARDLALFLGTLSEPTTGCCDR